MIWILLGALPIMFAFGWLAKPVDLGPRIFGEIIGEGSPERCLVDSVGLRVLSALPLDEEQEEGCREVFHQLVISFKRWTFLGIEPEMQGNAQIRISGLDVWVLLDEQWEPRLARALAHIAHAVCHDDPDNDQKDQAWFTAAISPWVSKEDYLEHVDAG